MEQRRSALATAGACIAIAIAGVWFPLFMFWWYDESDHRSFTACFGLPIILMYAILATSRLKDAYWNRPDLRPQFRRTIVLGLAFLCWLPYVLLAVQLGLGFIYSARQ